MIFLILSVSKIISANLVDNSPFIPDGFKAAAAPGNKPRVNKPNTAARNIEFRGVYSLDGIYHFNIYDKKAQKGEWLRLNDPGSTYRILRFDEETTSIQINLDGQTEELSLKQPDNKPLPVKLAAAQPGAGGGKRPAARTASARNRQNPRLNRKQPVVRRRVVVPSRTNNAKPRARPQQTRNTRSPSRSTPRNANDLINQLTNRRN